MAKDAYYFSHDSNASSDPKIMAMLQVYGMEGYGRWWRLVEMLREQSHYKLKACKWSSHAIAMAMLCDTTTADKFVQDCIDEFELLQTDGEHFWSNSLLRRMKAREDIRQKRRDAGRKGAEKRWDDSKTIAKPQQTDSTDIATDSKERKGKEIERKVKETKVKYADNVTMTSDEYEKLIEEHGETATKRMIEILDNYKGANGKKYKSDYRAILNWVVKRYQEEQSKPTKAKGNMHAGKSSVNYDDDELLMRRMDRAAKGASGWGDEP